MAPAGPACRRFSGTENLPAAHNRANALEELGFRAGLHRPLALAKPLTVGDAELTCLEFGSPNATLFITKNRELGREFDGRRSGRESRSRRGCTSRRASGGS